MQDWLTISLLYGVGVVFLLADFFLPSHGILTVVSFGLLGYSLYLTFQISEQVGLISLLLLAVAVPTIIGFAVKVWHRTPMGRRISPPNRVLTDKDRLPVNQLTGFIGMLGITLTKLRPVGMCQFDGQRVECVAEQGMIDANVKVEGVRLVDRTLMVRTISADNPKAA